MVSNLCKHLVEFRLLATMRSLTRETVIRPHEGAGLLKKTRTDFQNKET
jgi:hypothetical protein